VGIQNSKFGLPYCCHKLPSDCLVATSGETISSGHWKCQDEAGKGPKMNEIKTETKEASNHVLFPMAVGVLFLAMLVAGALLG
jgi:hypothetical protein